MNLRSKSGVLLLAVVVLSGCTSENASETGSTPATGEVSGDPGTGAAPATAPEANTAQAEPEVKVDLQEIDAAGFQSIIDAHRGNIVLVDFWATYCIPCLEMMPQTVELARKHKDAGLVVVLMTLDAPESKDMAVKMLGDRGAGSVTNLISKTGGGEEDFVTYDIDGGALPHIKIYDREGKVIRTFGGDVDAPFDHKDIEAAVEEALSAGDVIIQ